MSNFNSESVLSVHHWTDTLFSFTTTRDPSFRFRNGEFTMIGLKVGERPLLRAYSVASANYEDRLEFFSIKAPAPQRGRRDHRQPQGHRHAGDRQSRRRPQSLSDRDWYRAGAVSQRDQ